MSVESYTPKTLVTGSDPTHTTATLIASGHQLPAMTPLALKTASGEFEPWNPAASDGTQHATRLTAAAVDTGAAPAEVQAWKTGTWNPHLVNWPAGTTDIQKAAAFVGTPISLQLPG
ncbi:MAG: head decoration protein [Marinobacterium sp.]|nr:head decoration protein [Marinobacterium sp.]